jgi:ketosteroid isomerase-like protein
MLLLGAAGCRFQDRTPGSSRRDEQAVQGVVTSFYQAIGARDFNGLERVTLSSATALLSSDGASPALVPMRAMANLPERRNQGGGARIVRTELRPDGSVATDRVVVSARGGDGQREFEATDVLTLARQGGRWQVAHAMFGPWKSRSAP